MKALVGLGYLVCAVCFAAGKSQVVDIKVTEKGFEPNSIKVKADEAVILKILRTTDSTCATSIQIPDRKIKKDLPLNKSVTIALGKLKKGEVRFGCQMNMMDSGTIISE